MSTAFAQIPVGVVVARRKAASKWIDYTWQPVSILVGQPETMPWTKLSDDGDTAMFYAGGAVFELYRSETANYRDNLSGDNAVWVVLQPSVGDFPYDLIKVTADPTEGEAFASVGDNIVESLSMPENLRELVAAFIAEHHVEQPFFKRKRTEADPEALARHSPLYDMSKSKSDGPKS
ncbi:DUF3305 domain-containing protein [Pseudorhodoplanes sinuspersici]|uniref:Molybdopterin-guanine dinucleotide biosynthesis protein A n=1 Tax=Pseudorhodoplanes sinuspersici TaxID=1235591 RepID=A0A1W7A0E1_9HYPH|nr:DUF3305 domain-containing protein [Pseudorhodoplanes sinuspersici]ARQ02495.1 molybdopterin-guanine dinucleotide biosynthesis protein A [Pseudorhodoplanes sinuspersici]RKE74333.1 uncharacterized protein DUF3305 [Pseudorhodoplanes sinuspersici]